VVVTQTLGVRAVQPDQVHRDNDQPFATAVLQYRSLGEQWVEQPACNMGFFSVALCLCGLSLFVCILFSVRSVSPW
jgi:hypothetical protein